MRRWKVCLFFCLLSLFSFTSCRTVETVTEYVPVEIDVTALAQPVLQLKPEPVKLIENVQTLSDVMENSVAFQKAYEDWMSYALALEDFCLSFNGE